MMDTGDGAMLRWKGFVLGGLVGAALSVVLAGLLSLFRPSLVFAGFPMGAALGGALAGYRGRRLPLLQGLTAGLFVGLIELGFLLVNGLGLLPAWGVATLVVINGLAGLLGARLSSSLRSASSAERADSEEQATPMLRIER
jgi:hypothetical protein